MLKRWKLQCNCIFISLWHWGFVSSTQWLCHQCNAWWQFNITSDFEFDKLFSLSSNISCFSFKQREHLFDWELDILNWFFTAHVTFGLSSLLLSFCTRGKVLYHLYIYWCWMIFYGLLIIFECAFTNSFIISGLLILFCQTFLSLYTGCF